MDAPKRLARIAGSFYLAMFVASRFAGAVRPHSVGSGDAAARADRIRASATLFRVGFVADLVQVTCMLLAAMSLYLLLRHVHLFAAAAMLTFNAVAVGIYCLNLLNEYTAMSAALTIHLRHAGDHGHPWRQPL